MPYSKVLARDIMDKHPAFCHPETLLSEVAKRFAEENLSGMLMVDEDKRLLGVISETDLIGQQKKLHLPTAIALFDMVIPMGESQFEEELARQQAIRVEDLASTNVVTVSADADLSEVATIMSDSNIHNLPVLDGEAVVGMICNHDVIKALVHI